MNCRYLLWIFVFSLAISPPIFGSGRANMSLNLVSLTNESDLIVAGRVIEIQSLGEINLEIGGNVVELVCPSRVRALFDLTVADYTIPRAPLKSAAVGLQLRVAKNLDPSIQGFAGSFNPGVRTNLVGPFAEHGRTVQDLLNLIVGSSKGALWVATVPDGFRLRESPARFPIWSILEYQMSPAECRAILQNIGRDYPDPEQ